MNKQPTQKQINQFWVRYGFKTIQRDCVGIVMYETPQTIWVYPDGTESWQPPPISPNSLFRYAVPKYTSEVMLERNWDEMGVLLRLFRHWLNVYRKGKGILSLENALFWVLDQIKEAKNEQTTD